MVDMLLFCNRQKDYEDGISSVIVRFEQENPTPDELKDIAKELCDKFNWTGVVYTGWQRICMPNEKNEKSKWAHIREMHSLDLVNMLKDNPWCDDSCCCLNKQTVTCGDCFLKWAKELQ